MQYHLYKVNHALTAYSGSNCTLKKRQHLALCHNEYLIEFIISSNCICSILKKNHSYQPINQLYNN